MTGEGGTPHPDGIGTTPRLVVGLGASAGGVQALRDFFAHVEKGWGIAYVVVLHLPADRQSSLAEVLQTTAPIPVRQVTEATTIEAERAYVIAPHTTLQIVGDRLLPSQPAARAERAAQIDVFFRSLAQAWGPRSVAAVLSGTGSDGASGLRRVKEGEGLAIAPTPSTAEYDDIPSAAVATRLVDFVLPVAAMPARVRMHVPRSSGPHFTSSRPAGAARPCS